MQEFERYIKDVCDYIDERMKVGVYYEWEDDELHICFVGTEHRLVIGNILHEYTHRRWRDHPVGAVAQELMRDIKDEWISLLMRKDSV